MKKLLIGIDLNGVIFGKLRHFTGKQSHVRMTMLGSQWRKVYLAGDEIVIIQPVPSYSHGTF
jgi:hypothetical protein